MQIEIRHYIFSRSFDLLFIKFPIFFPLLYGVVLFTMPSYENLLILGTLLILAEPHFGATWPFFLDKKNKEEINKRKVRYVLIPIIIVIASLIGFFYANFIFLLLFFAVNMFHVTRQSYGVCKLYKNNEKELIYQEKIIYFFAVLFFIVAILRFYIPIITENNIFMVNSTIVSLLLIIFIYYFIKFKNFENFLTLITGTVMFLPICFVDKPIHGIIMGVTMHYTQYLALTYKIYYERHSKKDLIDDKKLSSSIPAKYIYLLIIIIYGAVMTALSNSFNLADEFLKSLIVIPLIGQMLHFYLDSHLWKFSEQHNREVTLKYLQIKK